MKKIVTMGLLCALLCMLCAGATAATVTETGTGITVVKASDWAETYPDVYASYQMNEQNRDFVDHVHEYPVIATVYEGMAFNKHYNSARGHYYTVEDVTGTGRPHALANCFACKTPDFTAKVNNEGVGVYAMPFEDVMAEINEPVSCYNCHANEGEALVVTHTYLADAMGADFATLNEKTAACAQCHVEYYFDPETKAVKLPYDSLAAMHPDQVLAYYEEMGFSDYTNPRTGVKQIKVQHTEFETYMGAGSVHAATFSCAGCHMAKEQNAAGETYASHYWVSPLQSETIMASCSGCHSDLAGFVGGIQARAEERTIAIGTKLETLTNALADAVTAGELSEEELDAVRALNRQGQFYWDFVFVENSEGAHNSRLTHECLDKAEKLIDEALALLGTQA